ncbi:MAG TPA: TIGR03067 domain-containing protein [Gemmatales bacterium]|nr:TIGR03067 domain-containing protein [Gemmatales bacterium]
MKLFFVGLTLVLATAIQARDDKSESQALQGNWSLASAELAGKPFPEQLVKTMSLTMKDGRYTVMVGQGKDEGTAKIDSSKTPKTMEITGTDGPNKGKTFLAIYKLDGDSLSICYDLSGKAYPTEFKTKPDTKLFLVEYKRDKSGK